MAKHVCPWWLAYTFDNPLRKFLHKPEKLLAPYVREGMTVVDFGCGMGWFSIGMARMVGAAGRVISVDIQQQMHDILKKRAQRAEVADRIQTILTDGASPCVEEPVDFALAFWVVHETPDVREFLNQIRSVLREGGRLLVAEPKIHVTSAEFDNIVSLALDVGFRIEDRPLISMSRAVVFGSG
jgi:ubiquinone/menaquinone biosynthesis C-methylase UbiE